ncbi:MAG: methyltransferase domain-containing protein [Actinobacteria bacterium]|nr:methyltransferase domain-containing protein [Actinomycetota bacterium]
MKCRHCAAELAFQLIDLGSAPPSNAYLTAISLRRPEKWFPLKVLVCETCWLVQAESYSRASELFNDEYAYFSSFSDAWLAHSERYVSEMVERFSLNSSSHVVEVASNDGYLLQYVKSRGIPCLGIEPTASTANAARLKGVETVERFFGVDLAKELVANGRAADLTAANNVLAHVPDINDFVRGFAELLKPSGVATFEFPHLYQLVTERQFDTIYHEHFSYLSFTTVREIFLTQGLSVFDVEEIGTHGGSLRVFAQRTDSGKRPISDHVGQILELESGAGMRSLSFYEGFERDAEIAKSKLLEILVDAKLSGKTVAAYGAAAKGNTFLNYAGVKSDLISFVVDRNPAKQGKWMPGSRIPIVGEERLRNERPEVIIILPWNIKSEVLDQLSYAKQWGARFVVAQPEVSFVG